MAGMGIKGRFSLLSSFLLIINAVGAQFFSGFFNITEFPNEQKQNVSKYLSEARSVAGDDIYPHFAHRCILNQVYPGLSELAQSNAFVRPAKPFDQVMFVGQAAWSSWAIDTGAGLVLFDTLNSPEEAENIIIPGIESFGYSGEDIKYVVITHEHGDHYNGARWLQEKYNPTVLASQPAWETMVTNPKGPIKNENSITISDGQQFRVGNTTFNFYITPGHTNGSVSTIFPVYDHGKKHIAGVYGGLGIPRSTTDQTKQINSLSRFAQIAQKAGVDILLANHQLQDRSIYHFDILAHRECGENACNTSNPFVVGIARMGLSLSI
ncbi:beta-lactamase-like protein [Bisporella sp. PMI_857]|nr:beta-lactamase-like protein [Bisporella sp. PMI_857]